MKKTIAKVIALTAMASVQAAWASEQTVGTTNVVVDVPSRAVIVSCQMRPTDPTIMDVVYRVESAAEKVKVRALAFKDGKRDFAHVLRPETFVDGTATNLGDEVAANVEHTLSWKVTADWEIDIGNVSFEVLATANTTNSFVLPYMYREEVKFGEIEYFMVVPRVSLYHDWGYFYNEVTGNWNESYDPIGCETTDATDLEYDLQRRNVLFWFYADRDNTLSVRDGRLYWNDSICLCDGTVFPYNWPLNIYFNHGTSDFQSFRRAVNEFLITKFKSFMNVDWQISPSCFRHEYYDW